MKPYQFEKLEIFDKIRVILDSGYFIKSLNNKDLYSVFGFFVSVVFDKKFDKDIDEINILKGDQIDIFLERLEIRELLS